MRTGARWRLSHRVRRFANGAVFRRRVYAPHYNQLFDRHPVLWRLESSMDRHAGKHLLRRLARKNIGAAGEGAVQHFSNYADSLDNSTVPVRPAYGAYMAS